MRVNLCLLADFTRGKCLKRTAGKHDQVGYATVAEILNAIFADCVLEPVPGIFAQCLEYLFSATSEFSGYFGQPRSQGMKQTGFHLRTPQ